MDIKINTLQKDRPQVPLLEGQIRLKEDKSRIILITRDENEKFGATYLKIKEGGVTHINLDNPGDKETFAQLFPIVADSTSLMINIK